MYLSKVILDIRHPSARQALSDANDMHRNLMAGFVMDSDLEMPRAEKSVLYRVIEKRDQIYLLVSSNEKPNPAELAKRGLNTDETMIRDVSSLREKLSAGRLLRFELLASPCKKLGGEANGRRFFLQTAEERLNWLKRKGEQGGFEVLFADETGARVDVVGRREGKQVKNSAVLFSGLLRITDAEAFWASYTCGIGPGKAYGLGMLTIAKS